MLDINFIQNLSKRYFPKEMLRKRRIVVIDDNQDIRGVLKIILEKQGYQVEAHSSSKPLYTIDNKNIPDLIIIDVMLQEEDGREACYFLKHNAATKHIPIIVYSANSSDEINNYTKSFKPDSVLSKPFYISDLKETIVKLLMDHGVAFQN